MKKQKIIITAFTIMTAIGISFSAHAQQLNFTGDWKRNTEACNPDGLSINSIPTALKITQDDQRMSVERTSSNAKSEIQKVNEVLKLDDGEMKFTTADNLSKKSVIRWSPDHKTMMEKVVYTDAQGNEVRTLEKNWSLSTDGKTLHITAVMTGNDESNTLEEYFDKQ